MRSGMFTFLIAQSIQKYISIYTDFLVYLITKYFINIKKQKKIEQKQTTIRNKIYTSIRRLLVNKTPNNGANVKKLQKEIMK